MPTKSIQLLLLLFVSITFTNCTSVQQYNTQLAQPISVENLHKDIDYTQHKLLKYYPNLYEYIPKEKLNYKFDSIKKTIQRPMTSKEFYFVISPVIASVRQGHMTMSPVLPKTTKKEAKRNKKAGDGPLSQFSYQWENNKLYITKNKTTIKDIKIGTEIVSVNNITPQTIYNKYKNTFTSDGFNTTFLRKFFTKRFTTYVTNEIGVNDSLTFVFNQKDSIYTKTIKRFKTEKKASITTKKDSIKTTPKPVVDKEKLKLEKKQKRIFGYDKKEKLYAKSLRFISKDSSVALLKIRNFTQGKYEQAYTQLFDSIKNRNAKYLILDIRDNPGGKVADVVNLYSHLTDKDFVMLHPAEVVSKTSLWKLGIFNVAPKITYPVIAAFYPMYMGFTFIKTKKQKNGTYQYKLVGSKPEKSAQNNFKGKIYVLINGGSFSASCILSSTLKSNSEVTFVGEETGGAFNGTVAGLMPVVKLPYSKIPLRLGLMSIKTISQTTDFVGRGIFPNKEIIPTIEDKINNNDPELNWILQEIEKNK